MATQAQQVQGLPGLRNDPPHFRHSVAMGCPGTAPHACLQNRTPDTPS